MGTLKLVVLVILGVYFNPVGSAVNGGWSGWSAWSGCAPGICAGNQKIRTRTCTSPIPSTDGAYCNGDNAQQQDCMVDGGFSEWSQWSQCDKPCGGSTVNRTRTCTNPKPTPDGKPCSGDVTQFKLECIWPCATGPVDGQWGYWSPWTSCPKSCGMPGGSIIKRTRQCNVPPPMNGGKACPGNDTETYKSCFTPCPVTGGFSLWSSWSPCSKTCGQGVRSKERTCTNPRPIHGGKKCSGETLKKESCRIKDCPGSVNGGWTDFSEWQKCTEPKYCFQGVTKRMRACTNPPPINGGDECVGLAVEETECPTREQGCTTYQPNKPDSAPAPKGSFIQEECESETKYSATGAQATQVPFEAYYHFNFMRTELESGWFAVQTIDDDRLGNQGKKLTKICFEIVDPLQVGKIVTNKATYYDKISPIPNLTRPKHTALVPAIYITLDENKQLRNYEFVCGKSDKYVPMNGFTLEDVRFSFYTAGNDQTFKARGDYKKVPTAIFDTTVKKDVHTAVSHAVGKTPSINFQQLLKYIGIPENAIPDFIKSALKLAKLWDFSLTPAEFAYKLDKAINVKRFTGSIVIEGVPVHVETILIVKMFRVGLAVGFSFDGESYGKLAKKLSGIGIGFLDKIGLQLEIGVSFSPPQLEKVLTDSQTNFAKEPLKSMIVAAVPQGLFIGAQLGFPKDCGGDKFCEISKMIVGPDFKFYLNGLIEFKKVKIAAGFRKIHIGFGLYFDKLELYVEASWNNTAKHIKLGFRADIKVPVNGEIYRDGILAPSNDLFLFGVLEYDFLEQEVAGKLGMRGMWRKAFFIPFLSIGNIYLGMTYQVGAPVPITGVQFGMRVEFGYDCLIPADFNVDGHCFGGAGYFGVGKPQFFYADMTALTLGKIFRLLGINVKLPKPIHETGFPETVMGSYSTDDVDLRIAGGPYIYKGFTLKGRVNIFGWEIFAHIKLSDNHILVDLKPDPVILGSVIKIVRSPSELSMGPWFYIQLRKDPVFFEAYIEGYIDLFSITTYCRLNLTMEAFELLIRGNFMGLIKAEVFVAANYPLYGLGGIKFYVKVEVDLYALNKLIDDVVAAIRGVFDAAKKKLGEARRAVIEKREECKRKMQLKCDNCKKLKCAQAERNCKGFLDKAGKWIGGVVNAVGKWVKKTFKKIGKALAPVGKFFKKVFKGWRRKRELQRVRNELFEVHIRRRRFISKLICEGIVGGGCNVVSKLCQGTCQAVNFIAKGLCHVLDVAVGFLKLTELACGWISKAIHFLSQIFRIFYIKFEFGLESYASGGLKDLIFNAAVDMMIFGHRFYAGVSFNLRKPFTSLKSAGDKGTNWYKDKMNPKGRTSTEKNYYDNANPFVDFELTEQFQIENQQSSLEERRGACMYVDSKAKGSLVKMTACKDSDEKQYFSYTLKGQIMSSYTKLCLDTNGAENGKELMQTDCKPSADNQNFQCDLVVRTMKRRRANMCLTAGKTGLTGPGSLTHVGSLKCIHVSGGGYGSVADGTRLVIHSGCNENRLSFEIKDGYLIHTASKKCARPVGSLVDGVQLGLYSSCAGHKFGFTKLGSLQHISSKKCVNPSSGKMNPAENEKLILNTKCENTESSAQKDHLLFAFVPTDPHVRLEKCCDFGNPRLDQRWEVLNEEIATICSKFSPNLAKHKLTSQSSVAYNGFPKRAVDENYNSNYNAKSCTHTNNENNPWWRVDLGREHIITDVLLVNRYNNFERLKNVEVRVGKNIDQMTNPTCNDRIRTVGQGQAIRLQCNPPIPGRYVAVQMFGKGILTLCEVSVYSRVGVLADLCQLDNGGCAQICYNQCDMKVKCGCGNGWKLAYDGKRCLDKDECQVNNGGCDIYHGLCINTPGSYYCHCKNGFQLKENSEKLCEDFNECNLNNAGCEHICNNTKGSYHCDCRKGYKLKADGYGCTDVDECATSNGGCQHKCSNYEGGYYCSCNPGYRLMDDDHHCEEIYCPALEAPFRGAVNPNLCTDDRANIRRGTVCTYGCVTGHNLVSGRSQTCKLDGTWQGTTPHCKPVMCPMRPKLANGGTVPAAATMKDAEYGQRVVYYCHDGYELRGPRYTTCQADSTWTEDATVQCVRVYRRPWISCPADVSVDLPPSQGTYILGFKWVLPKSNMKNVAVSPSHLSESYPFPAGKTRVTWTATNDNGDLKMCYYYVTVNDITPPKSSNCPSNIIIKTDSRWETVNWVEPVFTDNVGVINSVSSKKPGEQVERFTSLKVRYVATDAATNKGYCQFTVTVEAKVCVRPPSPKNGAALPVGQLLYLRCNPGYYFNPKPNGAYGFTFVAYTCRTNKWKVYSYAIQDYIALTFVPDCVAYTNPASDLSCPIGSVYEAGTGGKCLNCAHGTFFNTTSKKCQDCVLGSYQDEDGKTECQVCSLDSSTKSTRSKKASDCLPKCAPGYYSDNGLHEAPQSPCVACPRGTYNPFQAQTSCQFCPAGSSTSSTGSTSFDDCVDPAVITEVSPPSGTVLADGQDLVLECFIKGRPAPKVTWTKTQGVAPRPDRVKIRPLLDMNDLIGLEFRLSMIQTSDSGTYECRAQNGGGAHVVTKTVSITVRPRPATVAPSTAVPQA